MRQIRISGIVRTADHLRRALSQPLTASQRDALVVRLDTSLREIHAILDRHGASDRHLPEPSRRAYHFLKQLDLRAMSVIETDALPAGNGIAGSRGTATLPDSIRFSGLAGFLDGLLDSIAAAIATSRLNPGKMLEVVTSTRDRLDHHLVREGLKVDRLVPQARQLLAWFRWFAQEDTFREYVQAVRTAQAILGTLPTARVGWKPPLLVHFRPCRHIYRWKAVHGGTRITLATSMIVFDDAAFRQLANLIGGDRRQKQSLTEAMLGEAYQCMAVDLEGIVGAIERTRGVTYDLAEAFARVNQRYFASQMPRPKLRWGRSLTGRVFGHYEFVSDCICISGTLDQVGVPPFVLDYVLFHELLHKKHGIRWRGHRQHVHTPEFQAEERTFEGYQKACEVLSRLARTGLQPHLTAVSGRSACRSD